ncbi:hypothetical protein [Deinococcus radiodurans]|jgi:hypothetical protein|nr:hypothetical protein [Deinococcus radiodurans]ANC71540.1 hypothetical protein A2G07_07020 [Deinococcus radiodurans R1 = ATCC 13939 = DSM 20539]QEM70770.1 hypothetical protein DXG80_02675 [Deinococcus radiodurans]QIP29347.1 hypothetical protein HAV23_09435 [Deinococcus radiodurans]QIP31957.1 hypothetical protein HAV35_07365 [Deinococcus radiodurans]UDL00421.1 hypothetical protein E5E91_06760 [Deinococcus radiodurans R1 = ATCC 13939 = DSM 20539]
MEDIIMSLGFFAIVFGFPLVRREMKHRHQMERLREERALQAAQPAPEVPGVDDAPALALRIPEPHRLYVLALLCRLEDAPLAGLDARARYLISQARGEELPATLRAYLNLTPAARQQLTAQGQNPEELLREQLELMSQGVEEALGRDSAAADRMLAQGHYLRQKFQPIELGEPVAAERRKS